MKRAFLIVGGVAIGMPLAVVAGLFFVLLVLAKYEQFKDRQIEIRNKNAIEEYVGAGKCSYMNEVTWWGDPYRGEYQGRTVTIWPVQGVRKEREFGHIRFMAEYRFYLEDGKVLEGEAINFKYMR